MTRTARVAWSEGASPDATVEALTQEALTVAVLDALLEDPELRAKAVAALRGPTANRVEPTR